MDKCNVVISKLRKELETILIGQKGDPNGLVAVKLFGEKCNKEFDVNCEERTKTNNFFIT
jgi:hypothetical protein